MLSRLGVELLDRKQPTRPVTMPALKLDNIDIEAVERAATAAKFLEARTIRAGVECWQAIGRAESFEAWVKIGKALQIGRDYALKTTGANRPMGQIYCRTFSAWIDQHGFSGIEKSVRSAALDLAEHLEDIEAWRLTLNEKRRRQLKHPLSNVAAWRKATQHRAAVLAWARFCACTKVLPADQAAPLWRAAQAQAAEVLGCLPG
jgi:hypothetical protein